MRVSCRFTLTPHGEYRVGTGPHARQSWGADAPMSRPAPPPDLGPDRATGYTLLNLRVYRGGCCLPGPVR